MRRVSLLRAVVATTATTLLVSACDLSASDLPLPGGADVGDDSYAVSVEFRDVLDLVPQSAVKVDDVTVGKVEDISLDGWTAVVKVRVRGDVALPENAVATIRQTSLLGEKFVSLAPPDAESSAGTLADGDTIPISRSGRNPEVEEVLGALSLVLNGGGFAQLKTISREVGNVLDGNESEVRSVVNQLDVFMGQLDDNKSEIVSAIEALNRLTRTAREQEQSIVDTVDDLPDALKVLDEQRAGLVRMLHGLRRLSPVAVRVIERSKQATLADLEALDPILTQLARAGDAVPKSFQLLLTYPFVDAAVGTDPRQAKAFRQGDYTNLAVTLDLDLGDLPQIGLPHLPSLQSLPLLNEFPELPSLSAPPALPTAPTGSEPSGANPSVPELSVPTTLPSLPDLSLPGLSLSQLLGPERRQRAERFTRAGYDEDLALLLLQGVLR
jgi:phospholipid/cholesterol/gamma-HCH transport system substrate-binding protein